MITYQSIYHTARGFVVVYTQRLGWTFTYRFEGDLTAEEVGQLLGGN